MQFSLLVLVVLAVVAVVLISSGSSIYFFTSYYWASVPSDIIPKPHDVKASQLIIHLK